MVQMNLHHKAGFHVTNLRGRQNMITSSSAALLKNESRIEVELVVQLGDVTKK